MKIGDVDIDRQVLIIAEVGNNHEGNFGKAQEMIGLAAEAGANAVKFQTFQTEHLVTVAEKERFNQLKKFEFSYDQFEQLAKLARESGLIFLTTPFDLQSVDAIEKFVSAYKISSGDNTFWPLLEKVASKGKPILMSTGLTAMNDLEKAVGIIKKHCNFDLLSDCLILLHCISSYPALDQDLNLLSIKYLKDYFGLTVGYSDHSQETLSCVVAVALGARVIEKHFTYKKEGQSFRDHQLSADPLEFKGMVRQIRSVEEMLGEYKKEPMPVERALFVAARRSIAVNRNLRAGEVISIDDITWVRPAKGFKPGEENLVLGRKLKRDINKGEIIENKDIL